VASNGMRRGAYKTGFVKAFFPIFDKIIEKFLDRVQAVRKATLFCEFFFQFCEKNFVKKNKGF
jgi:hypothetical protein